MAIHGCILRDAHRVAGRGVIRGVPAFLVPAALIGGAGGHAVCLAREAARVAARIACTPAQDLQMMPARPAAPGSERRVAWQAGIGDGRPVHFAPCDATGRCRWERAWADAYRPSILSMHPVHGIMVGAGHVLLLLFNQGAEAQAAIVIGLGGRGHPVILDRLDAAAIGTRFAVAVLR